MVPVAQFGTGQVLWSMFWLFLFFIWIWLLILVFSDIFRSRDLGGFAKVMWIVFVVVVPYLGVFVYLIARGNRMQEHAQRDAEAQNAAFTAAVQDAVGTGSSAADELAKLSELKNNGAIDDAEYQRLKADVIG